MTSISCFGSIHTLAMRIPKKKVCNFVGGVVSPILSNIYMDRFDKFVHNTLIPEYTRGRRRQLSHAYRALQRRAQYYRQTGNIERANALRKQLQQQPSVDPHDVGLLPISVRDI